MNYAFKMMAIVFVLGVLATHNIVKAANIIANIAISNFPSKANLIELNPIQTPIKVNIFGSIILAFLSETIFKLFFGCSIISLQPKEFLLQ